MNVDPWVIAVGAAAALLVARRLVAGARAPAELVRERIASGAKIVDVRTPGEFGGGAYPGAVNIPLQVLAGRLREIPKDRPVVLYCASGMRSASAARVLRRAGYADVVNAGGLRHMPA
jgi:phage shock protein E